MTAQVLSESLFKLFRNSRSSELGIRRLIIAEDHNRESSAKRVEDDIERASTRESGPQASRSDYERSSLNQSHPA